MLHRERRVVHVDRVRLEVGGVEVGRAAGLGERETLVVRLVVVGHHDGVGTGIGAAPRGDVPGLRVEDEGRRRAGGRDHEPGGRVEDESGRSAAVDRHDQRRSRDRASVHRTRVDGARVGVVVGHPDRGRRAGREPPRVLQVRVGELRNPGLVADEVRDLVAVVGRRSRRCHHRCDTDDESRRQPDRGDRACEAMLAFATFFSVLRRAHRASLRWAGRPLAGRPGRALHGIRLDARSGSPPGPTR